MNKCMAFDRKFLFTFILFPGSMLSLRMSEFWNKRVGSRFSYFGLVGVFEAPKKVYVAGLLLRLLGYRLYVFLDSFHPSRYSSIWWSWFEECIEEGENVIGFLKVIRKRSWSLDMCCIMQHFDGCMVCIDVYEADSVMIYDKRSNFWWNGSFVLVELWSWDWSSIHYGLFWVQVKQEDKIFCLFRADLCMFMIKIFTVTVYIVIRDGSIIDAMFFRLWVVFVCFVYKVWYYDRVVECIRIISFVSWGGDGCEKRVILKCGLYIWMLQPLLVLHGSLFNFSCGFGGYEEYDKINVVFVYRLQSHNNLRFDKNRQEGARWYQVRSNLWTGFSHDGIFPIWTTGDNLDGIQLSYYDNKGGL